LITAVTKYFPIPGMENMYSMINEPVISPAKRGPEKVIKGVTAFLRHA